MKDVDYLPMAMPDGSVNHLGIRLDLVKVFNLISAFTGLLVVLI